MDHQNRIRHFIRNANIWLILLSLVRSLTFAVPALCFGVLFVTGFDRLFAIPLWGRQVLWLLVVLSVLVGLARGFFPIRKFTLKRMSARLFQRQMRSGRFPREGERAPRPDDFRNAVQLMKTGEVEGISTELKTAFLTGFAETISRCHAAWCFPEWRWQRGVLIATILTVFCGTVGAFFPIQFPMKPRVLFPFGSTDLSRLVKVTPGDGFVDWGGDIEIKVAMQVKSINKPVLFARTGKDWLSVEPVSDLQGIQLYQFQGLVEPLHYRLKWKKDWGEKYVITPLKPIQLSDFRITLRQPDYVGGQVIRQNAPELTGLPGCAVTLQAEASQPLKEVKILFSDGSENQVQDIEGNTFVSEFTLFKSGTYGFSLKSESDKVSVMRNLYPINVVEDYPPAVVLLSPETDLVVGETEEVPLTFHAKDDYGVKQVDLVWRIGQGKEQRRAIRRLGSPSENVLETYEWDLGEESFRPGELIQYQIAVADGNIVTGPGTASTDWNYIEIASFEKGHEALEEALEAWRDELLDMLADVDTLKSEAEKAETKLPDLVSDFNKAAAKSSQLEEQLEKIVSLMEEDPLADYGVWLEHQAMADNMEAMNQGNMKRAQSALQTQNKKAAVSEMEQIAAELERMLTLSEALSKTQRARDVMDKGDQLADLGEDLLNQLEEAGEGAKLDPKQLKQIQDMVAEAQKMLAEMAQSLQKFPDELPEDFINQEALKDIPVQESHDILSQINQALQEGDMKKALDLAKQFLEMAQKMSDQLNEAHESYQDDNSAADLAEQMSAEQKKLEEITQEQRDILAETQKLESKRLAAYLAAQEKLLEELSKRQEAVIKETEALAEESKSFQGVHKPVSSSLKPMRNVAAELTARRIDKSVDWLNFIIQKLDEAGTEVQRSTRAVQFADKIQSIHNEEKEILSLIEKKVQPQNVFNDAEKKRFDELNQQQSALSRKTMGLKQGLQRLSQQTASLGVSLSQSLNDAGEEMSTAAQKLQENASRMAQISEETALRHLQKAQSALEEAQGAMGDMAGQQMKSGSGKGGGGQPRMIQRGQRSGSRGTQTGKVRLPTAEDYKPPKEFREELLESLREKYPEIYKEIIHKYFKRLSE